MAYSIGTGLNKKNRKYTAVEDVREMAVDLYAGSDIVKAKSQQYLFLNSTEGSDAYNFRLKRAVYDNWAFPPIQARKALIWNKKPTRTDFDKDLEPFIDGVDSCGNTANVFFSHVSERAEVEGMGWVFVNGPPSKLDDAGEVMQRTAQQVSDEGLRPIMTWIPGGNVFDWQENVDGSLDWLVVASTRIESAGPGKPEKEIEQRTVWYPDRWELHEQLVTTTDENKVDNAAADNKGHDPNNTVGEGFELKESGPNEIGVIPFVPFYGIKEVPYKGWPVIKDILCHIISIYNKASDRDLGEFKTNNPIPVVIGEDNPQMVVVGVDSGIFLKQQSKDIKPSVAYLEHSGTGVDESRKTERDIIRRIFEIMLMAPKADSAQVQSEGALKQENRLFNASLSTSAVQMQQGEVACWQLFSKWLGIAEFDGVVTYQTDFDDNNISSQLLTVLSTMVEKNQFSRESFLQVLDEKEVLPVDVDVEEELRRIDTDMDSIAMPGFTDVPNDEPVDDEPDDKPKDEEEADKEDKT